MCRQLSHSSYDLSSLSACMTQLHPQVYLSQPVASLDHTYSGDHLDPFQSAVKALALHHLAAFISDAQR